MEKDECVVGEAPPVALGWKEVEAAIRADAPFRFPEGIVELNYHGDRRDPPRDPAVLASALASPNNVRWVNLSWFKMGAPGAEKLADVFRLNTTLTHIVLTLCDIGDDGAIAITKALAGKATKVLSVRGNDIGPRGAAAVAELVASSATLLTVSLEDNPIGDDGGIVLARALVDNASVTTLYLDRTDVTDRTMQALLAALAFNRTLYYVGHPMLLEGVSLEMYRKVKALLWRNTPEDVRCIEYE